MNQTVSDYRFKFSVVTAVYNVEPYLAEAIESILAQDIGFEESVEIILIDDGSTDRSGAICDEYQQKFPDNIKVIHKENGGAASARNIGISHCEGQYISFMDADDRLTSSTLSDVYGFFSTCDANIPFVSVPIYFFEKRDFGHRLNYKYECENSRIIDLAHEYSFVQMSASSAFFRHKIIQDRSFDTTLKYAEDAKLIMDILLDCPRYGIVPSGRYMYRTRNALDSALNVSKHRKEWYIDSLKYYTFWALDESERRLGYIPDFVQYIKEVCQEFRTLYDNIQGVTPYCVKRVAVLNCWGKMRSWGNHMVHHAIYYKQNYSYFGIIEALSGAPFDVSFISFDDILADSELLKKFDVVINAGDADTAQSGGEYWCQ